MGNDVVMKVCFLNFGIVEFYFVDGGKNVFCDVELLVVWIELNVGFV